MATFSGLTKEQIQKFEEDGLLVIEDFLTLEEVQALKDSCNKLVDEMNPKEHRGIFSTVTHNQADDIYFLESGNKVRFFFEKDSFNDDGSLKVEKGLCLNKIGHWIHWEIPEFKKVSFSNKTKLVARDLGFTDPAIVQGMYIFKQPKIGSEVIPHQDGTFLYNDPLKLVGFWFPIDDATLENGCLWYAPKSHQRDIKKRFIRNPAAFDEKLKIPSQNGEKLLIFEGQDDLIPDEDWVAAPVKKGSLVIIHGQVVHKSEANTSSKPRHAYTFHIIETEGSEYSEKNWLQPEKETDFPKLFSN